MLVVADAAGERRVRVVVPPAPRAIVAWNASAPAGSLTLAVETAGGARSAALPYVAFAPGGRRSFDGADAVARIATDIVHANDLVAVELAGDVALDAVAVSVARHGLPPAAAAFEGALDVPAFSQYVAGQPEQRGWCTPAAIAMLLALHGSVADVATTAAAIHDERYGGTGNWAFAVAYAAQRGLFGAAAYLRDLRTVDALLAAGLPPALSIAWSGDLPGAPLPASAGHLVVVRGRTAAGDVIVNDPAQPEVRCVYPRAAFERAWQRHGGVALLVAPRARRAALVQAANA